MVAVLVPTPHANRSARPAIGPRTVVDRPALRVIEGGRSARRPTADGQASAGVYLRRRVLVGLLSLVLLGLLLVGVPAAVSLLTAPVTSATPPAAAGVGAPIAADSYTVLPGDTLWSIATRLDPAGDPRPVVDALRQRTGGAVLDAGQRIDVSGLAS